MSMPLRPIAFQVAASMVLWECYCSLGKPTEAAVDHGVVLRVVAPADLSPDSEAFKDLAVICAESVEAAPAWLEKEGLVRRAGDQSFDTTEWELTLLGVAALNLKLSLDREVPEQSAAERLAELTGQVMDEGKGRLAGWVVDGFGAFFARLLPVIQGMAQ